MFSQKKFEHPNPTSEKFQKSPNSCENYKIHIYPKKNKTRFIRKSPSKKLDKLTFSKN
jgi:hypothetical protein